MTESTWTVRMGFIELIVQSEPDDPGPGVARLWVSNGAELGNRPGDVIMKITNLVGMTYETKIYTAP